MKLSTGKLILILVGLAIIYGVTEIFRSSGKSKSVREELVDINIDNISRIIINSPENNFELDKEEDSWKMTLPGGIVVNADSSRVFSSLNTLQTIKPSRVVTRKNDKWSEYKVDSTGLRIRVFEENESPSLDLVIGRFGVQNQRDFYTYVRLYEDDNVYVADDFMGFSISSDPSSYRDQILSQIAVDSITSIQFNYPDSGFILTKSLQGIWEIDGYQTDSTLTYQFLNSLGRVNSSGFYDESEQDMLLKVDVLNQDRSIITFEGLNETGLFLLKSSINESTFNDSTAYHSIFKSKEDFAENL